MSLENVDDVYPLAPIQEGMLFHSIASPNSGVFIQQIVTELSGSVDVPRLKIAWESLVSRHAALRTAFLWDGLDEPLQVVRSQVTTSWTEEDWRTLDETESQKHLETLLDSDRHADFDLAQAPLSRMTLIRQKEDSWIWIWSFHHIQCDGWSTHLLLKEIWSNYHSSEPAHDQTLDFSDYIAWLKEQDQAEAEHFWRNRLAGFREASGINIISNKPTNHSIHRQQTARLSATTSQQIREFAREHRLTLNSIFQGAWAVCLSQYARTTDVVFGSTVAGRPATVPGIETAIGSFINTLPTRVDVDPEQEIVDWLTSIQKNQLESSRFEYSSLARIQSWSEVGAGEALFQSILVFENYPNTESRPEGDLKIEKVRFLEQSNYPIAVLVVPGDELELILVHDQSILDEESASRVIAHVQVVLKQIIASAGKDLRSVSILSQEEKSRILSQWNHSLPEQPCAATLHELIEAQCIANPASVAATFQTQQISYAQLGNDANKLATELRAAGVRPGQRVGLYIERSLDMLVGILGILKCGAAYVPLNPKWPTEHLHYVIQDSGTRTIVLEPNCGHRLPSTVSQIELHQYSGEETLDEPPAEGLIEATSAAYVIYTSGSTGKPKGVEVSHANIVATTKARDDFYPTSPSSFLLLSSFTFDSSMAGLFWTLTTGGTLVLPDEDGEKDLHQLLNLIREYKTTHLLCLPSLYNLLLEAADAEDLLSLTDCIVAGETCPPYLVVQHSKKAPRATLYNEYGPTEASVWCVAHRLAEANEQRAPIGRPISCARAYVLDQHQRLLPSGIAGELYVSGKGVVQGYFNHPDLTDARFFTDPYYPEERMYRTGDMACFQQDGTLEFLGRVDRQVKIRGHRVELDAIENILRSNPEVQDAVVAIRNQPPNTTLERLTKELLNLPNDLAENLLAQVERTDSTANPIEDADSDR